MLKRESLTSLTSATGNELEPTGCSISIEETNLKNEKHGNRHFSAKVTKFPEQNEDNLNVQEGVSAFRENSRISRIWPHVRKSNDRFWSVSKAGTIKLSKLYIYPNCF